MCLIRKNSKGVRRGVCRCGKGFHRSSKTSSTCVRGKPGRKNRGKKQKPKRSRTRNSNTGTDSGASTPDEVPSEPTDNTPDDQASPPPADDGQGDDNGEIPCDEGLFTKEGCKRAQDTVDRVNEFRISQVRSRVKVFGFGSKV